MTLETFIIFIWALGGSCAALVWIIEKKWPSKNAKKTLVSAVAMGPGIFVALMYIMYTKIGSWLQEDKVICSECKGKGFRENSLSSYLCPKCSGFTKS